MKKILAVLMVLCLFACSAMAEVAEVNWSDVEEAVAEVPGDFYTFDEIAVKLWIPEGLDPVELTEEDVQAGYIGYFANDEAALAVVYANVDGMSIEDYAAALPEAGASEIAMLVINGLPAVRYQLAENDSLNIAFATEAGYVLEITMAPLSAEGADVVWSLVGASIQAA